MCVGCGNHPVDTIENTSSEENIKAFHWEVTPEEAAKAQKIFPKLGGVLFTAEYDHAQYLDNWVAIYQANPEKLRRTIELYGEPEYIILGTDEPNNDDHTSYLTPEDFGKQLERGINDLKSLELSHIPIVSAGLAPKYADFDWIYWYEVEAYFDVSKLDAVAFNANKTSIDNIERFIDYFAERSQTVVLQPAPFNDTLNRVTGGSEHIRTFFRLSQRPEVLSVNIWNLYDRPALISKGLLDNLGTLLYSGDELKRFFEIEVQNSP